MKSFVKGSILSAAMILSITGCSTPASASHNSNQVHTAADTTTQTSTSTTVSSSQSVTYVVNGQAVMTGDAVNQSTGGTTYLPLSDIQDLLLPTLHVEANGSQHAFNLTGSWEPNPFNILPKKDGTARKNTIALEVNGHPYVIAKSLVRNIQGKQVTYVSVADLTLFLQNALNVHASWQRNQLSLEIGHTMFAYQGYQAVKPGESVPSYESGQVGMSTFPTTTKEPAHSPSRASALGVASSFTWNVVPVGYGWHWDKGTVKQKQIQSTNTDIIDSYNGIRVEYKLVKQFPAVNHLPAIAIVNLTVGATEYRIQLYRPKFSFAWAIYNEVQYPPAASS